MNTAFLLFSGLTIVCMIAAVILIKKEARRLLNGLLLGAAAVLLFFTAASLLSTGGGNTIGFQLVRGGLYAIYIVIFLMGLILIANCLVVVKKEGKSIPNILPFFFGIVAMISAFSGYNEVILGVSGSETYVLVMTILYKIALYVPFVIGAVLIYSIVYLHLPKDKKAKYIIVLGCGLRANGEVTPLLKGRLDKAISWYKNGGKMAKFVVSGGQGRDEIMSEAEAMRNYLLSQEIPEEQILIENKSVNTRENLLFSNAIIEKDGGGSKLLCTSNYHVLRSVIYARSIGVDAEGIGGHTALYYLPVAFFREYIAMIFKYKAMIIIYLLVVIISELIPFL